MRKPFVMVKMEASKTTSKTGSLKALLLRAWRERWTDIQWGINIKTVLPRGVSGDVYNLADCILQQAMVGCGVNQLVISYLQHSLAAHLVSYAAVLQRISKFDALHKPHCVISLLEFLESILDGVTSRGKLEEGLLSAAVLSVVYWLLQVYCFALSKYPNTNIQQVPSQDLLEKPAALLNTFVNTEFLLGMIYLAKQDDVELYNDITRKCQEIISFTMMNPQLKVPVTIEATLQKLCMMNVDKVAPLNDKIEQITFFLQAVLAIEVLSNPCADTQVFVNELLMVQRIKGFTLQRLYCELIRASLISLNDASGDPTKQSVWGAFTFLKVPQIIQHIHIMSYVDDKPDHSTDVVEAFELLLQSPPLLDMVDSKCSCNCVQSLLEGLNKLGLVADQHKILLIQKREASNALIQKLEPTGLQGPVPQYIFRAETTLAGLLKTMDSDYVKNQDALHGMFCQVLSGKNLQVILAVATVEGKLKHFVSKLIKFNEYSLQPSGDTNKSAQSKLLMFDITFLMLCTIVQEYGPDAVLEDGGESFFEQWQRDCMVEKDVPKSPDQMLLKCEPSKIDLLLHQLITQDVDFKSSPMKGQDLCINVCGAIREILFAWEQGSLTATDVKRILDLLRQKMTSLAVCASAWLCSYMHIAHQDALLKPSNMVQQFVTPLTEKELTQSDNFKERSFLMMKIIKNMQYPPIAKTKCGSRQPISEQLQTVWDEVKHQGWLRIESVHVIKSLLSTGGPVWFVSNLVKEVLKFRYQDDLDRAVDLAFAMFHLDIEKCSQALILKVLPQYLFNSTHIEDIVEPQSTAFAKLCVYCIYAALEYSSSLPTVGTSRKRQRFDDPEDIEAMCPTNKLRRLNDNTAESSTALFANASNPKSITLREPLQSALQDIFKSFSQLAGRDGEVSPQTYFIFQFLNLTVRCGRDRAQVVLQGMPSDLIPTLIKALPEKFNIALILRLYDLVSISGKKYTARDLCMMRNMELRPN